MGNTFNTVTGNLILQEILSTLLVEFPMLNQITRDFSAQQAKLNQTIYTRVVVAGTAIAFNSSNGYVEADRTTVDVPITINTHVHHTFAVTDVEQSGTNRNLRDELVPTAVHALGTKIVGDLFAIILAAKFPLFINSSAPFLRADMASAKLQLNQAFVPSNNRFCVLNSLLASQLALDTIVIANPSGFNPQGIPQGLPPVIDGFAMSEFATLPTNAENLAGIAGTRDALLMATRLPDVPADPSEVPGTIRVATEPNTGLSCQNRRYYDMKFAKLVESYVLMYGFAAGYSAAGTISNRLVRIRA